MADSVAVIESDSPPVVVIEEDGDEVTVLVSPDGPRGPAGSTSGADSHFVFNQGAPATTWTIAHNLNKFPSVVVQDSANSEVEGDIEYVSVNELKLKFSAAFSGTAYLN